MWLSDRRSLLFGAAAAVTLAGCGFAPAYGTSGAASRLQNALRIEEPDSQNAYFRHPPDRGTSRRRRGVGTL